MSKECDYLHNLINNFERYNDLSDTKDIPTNGVYFLFEKGEKSHGVDRIVRVGTHTGDNNLIKRLNEHMYVQNKDRSIFRKHIGRSLLKKNNDSFFECWEIDLTTKAMRQKYQHKIDKDKLELVENEVSDYINKNFSYCFLPVLEKPLRLAIEKSILCTLVSCDECKPSREWLGKSHPNKNIRECGLWNIQGLSGQGLSIEEIKGLIN